MFKFCSLQTQRDQKQKRLTVTITIVMPKIFDRENLFAELATRYGLSFDLRGIILGQKNDRHDWLHLRVSGAMDALVELLIACDDLEIEVWH